MPEPKTRSPGLGLGFPQPNPRRKRHQNQPRRRRKSSGKQVPISDDNPTFSLPDRGFPDASLHLAGRGVCNSQDPDPQERRASFDFNPQQTSKAEVDEEVGSKKEGKEEVCELSPSKYSFSLALRECQYRRFRSEGFVPLFVGEQKQRSRPASIDLNCHMSDTSLSSPQSFAAGIRLTKSSVLSVRGRSGMLTSPGTPNYRYGGGATGYQKGWSSERVPLPGNYGSKFGSSAALLPLGNGKVLPSKWEDAEKWICSPVSVDGVGTRQSALQPHHRRPKSKSGPLGSAAGNRGFYATASPCVPSFDNGRMQNFMGNSPFTAGVLVADRGCSAGSSERGEGFSVCGEGEGRSHSAQSDHSMTRSASVRAWSELMLESSSSFPSSSQDGKLGSTEDGSTTISSVTLTKDMATQMSPDDIAQSSPKRHQQPNSSPHASLTIGQLYSQLTKSEVRDVQVDDQVTMTRWSKKHIAQGLDRKETVVVQPSTLDVAKSAKCSSKSKREEAKITAWENLQKAKAEAAIRKLEMKLEKKRSSTMDKILSKLRSSQQKADEMRKTVAAGQLDQAVPTSKKLSISRKSRYIGSFGSCFKCQAF